MKPELRQQMRLARAAMQDALACQVPGCSVFIRGKTGFDEIDKLRRHYQKAHLSNISTDEALALRIRMERMQAEALQDLEAARMRVQEEREDDGA